MKFGMFYPVAVASEDDLGYAALQEGRRSGIHAEEGEIDPSLSCYATPLLRSDRDEKLALAISFESRRPESDRRVIQQALRREWREFAGQI